MPGTVNYFILSEILHSAHVTEATVNSDLPSAYMWAFGGVGGGAARVGTLVSRKS